MRFLLGRIHSVGVIMARRRSQPPTTPSGQFSIHIFQDLCEFHPRISWNALVPLEPPTKSIQKRKPTRCQMLLRPQSSRRIPRHDLCSEMPTSLLFLKGHCDQEPCKMNDLSKTWLEKHRRRITPNTATLLFSVILLNDELMTVHLCEDCLILLERQFIFACWATIQIVAELHFFWFCLRVTSFLYVFCYHFLILLETELIFENYRLEKHRWCKKPKCSKGLIFFDSAWKWAHF